MKTVVDNRTGVLLTVRDSYEVDLNSGECFPGWLEFSIPPNGKQAIRSGMFVEELLKWRCYQQIHVMSGDELLLVLPHDAFVRNKGKELLLAMQDGDRRSLRYEFVEPAPPRSFAHWIRSVLSVVGVGSREETRMVRNGFILL